MGYEITVGGADACKRIIDRVDERLENLDVQYELLPGFAHDLYERLPDGAVRPYECYVEDEAVGGVLVLESGDTTYGWQGGTKYRGELAINDVLDWYSMRDAMDRGMERMEQTSDGRAITNRSSVRIWSPITARYDAHREPKYSLKCGVTYRSHGRANS
ncbi:GNAT family N-acetyltransferase [Halalkalicoccus salilacus]|uniref:GNAT family N-acetyltransferase n=1 Tax=Halalkalicoccus TaxID=332246 RepID=UPI00360F665B